MSSPNPSYAGTPDIGTSTPMRESTALVPPSKYEQDLTDYSEDKPKRPILKWILIGGVALAVVVVAVVVPVYFKVIKPNQNSGNSHSGNNGDSPADDIPSLQDDIMGYDGSTIVTLEGEFTYNNTFGGYWYFDPKDPLNNSAKAQSYTPALNETWDWSVNKVYGVNLGGWFVLEPFISPALFEPYAAAGVEDEYSLMEMKRADGTIDEIEDHYKTFITEHDFAAIAGAGLNYIRLPIGYWAVQTFEGEPYLETVQWKYIVRAFTWARKYGLRINLDLHAHPGSQNGWNHSGFGRGIEAINWLNGIMGIANAQRSLDYIRILTQFISQPQYSPVVTMFGIVNEPRMAVLDRTAVESFNFQAYQIIREISGVGEGKGPIVSIHDGFTDITTWYPYLNGADRLALDTHPYVAFDGANTDPVTAYPPRPCSRWGSMVNSTLQSFGILTAGEWSVAINDCGQYVTGVGGTQAYGGGSCAPWEEWETWDQTTRDALLGVSTASMDALQNWFFWTWRIGENVAGNIRAPFWSYRLGLQEGWIPRDPRTALGTCESLGVPPANPFDGSFEPWMTGGDESATPTVTGAYQWPPAALGSITVAAYLPTYTPTGIITTLPGPTFTGAAGVDVGDGWFNDADTIGMHVPVPGCAYPDAWLVVPTGVPVGSVCDGVPIPEYVPGLGPTTSTTDPTIPPTTTPDDPTLPTPPTPEVPTDPTVPTPPRV